MTKTRKTLPDAGISQADLAYAIGQLVELGRTTAAEVTRLASERTRRIAKLQEELDALRKGLLPPEDLLRRSTQPRKTAPKKTAPKKTAPKKTAPKKTAPKKTAPKKTAPKETRTASGTVPVGQVIRRKDGRSFTRTQKVADARRDQGRYLGYLRQVAGPDKEKFRVIARTDGVPAAIAAILKHLGR